MNAGTHYTKLFHSILDSTVWLEDLPTKVVWITMLAMADKDGIVEAAVPGLAHRAGVDLEECRKALAKFEGPDKWSRTKENEGRRIERVKGGWRLLNHGYYRDLMSQDDRREYNRVKQAEYREKRKRSGHKGPMAGEAAYVRAEAAGDEHGMIRPEEIRDGVPPASYGSYGLEAQTAVRGVEAGVGSEVSPPEPELDPEAEWEAGSAGEPQ